MIRLELVSVSLAAPLAIEQTSQPLADLGAFQARLASLCGVFAVAPSDGGPEEVFTSTASCSLRSWAARGQIRVTFQSSPLLAAAPSANERLVDVEGANIDLLVGLGFDERDFGSIRTASIMRWGDDSPSESVEIMVKTWIDRAVGGVRVAGNRVVVSRGTQGEIREIEAMWPTLDAHSAIEDGLIPGETDRVIAEFETAGGIVASVEPMILFDALTAGRVVSGRKVEILHLPPHEGEKGRGLTLYNGSILELP